MAFWKIFCSILAFGSIGIHDGIGRKVVIAALFGLVFVPLVFITESFSWSMIIASIPTVLLSSKILCNQMERDAELNRINRD